MTAPATTTSDANGSAANGAPLTGAPACPKCGGKMWDNRHDKRNPKAPDFKCRDRACDGRIWPGQHHAAEPIIARRGHGGGGGPGLTTGDAAAGGSGKGSAAPGPAAKDARDQLRRCYLDVTDFVLTQVRPKYAAAEVPCSDATVAAIAATLFIATWSRGGGGGA